MVSKLVLGYPEFKEDGFEWIQSIREKHDERYYEIVKPHFTIVFPVFDCSTDLMMEHIKKITDCTKAIKFNIKAASIVKDSFSDYSDVFLVPDLGNSDIIKLHDRLYTELLEKDLRLDIPFIPHIGIAGSTDADDVKKISDELNNQNFEIIGEIKTLDLVEYEYPRVETIKKFELK